MGIRARAWEELSLEVARSWCKQAHTSTHLEVAVGTIGGWSESSDCKFTLQSSGQFNLVSSRVPQLALSSRRQEAKFYATTLPSKQTVALCHIDTNC